MRVKYIGGQDKGDDLRCQLVLGKVYTVRLSCMGLFSDGMKPCYYLEEKGDIVAYSSHLFEEVFFEPINKDVYEIYQLFEEKVKLLYEKSRNREN